MPHSVLALPLQLLMIVMLGIAGILMCVAAVLLVWVCVALTGLFTIIPASLLHMLLR